MAKQIIIFDPPELLQTALTKVNENFTELYENPSDEALTKTESFNVNPAVRTYRIDRTDANIVATFDFTTCNGKTFDFIIIDNSSNNFSVNDTTGSATFYGSSVPFNVGALQNECYTIYCRSLK